MRFFVGFSLIFFISSPAFSGPLDGAYYTHGNFSIYVDAMKRIALFYSADLSALIVGIFILGMLVSGATSSSTEVAQRLSGSNPSNNIAASVYNGFLGLAFFYAIVLPKSDIHVYDENLNKYELVPDLPVLVTQTLHAQSALVEAFRETESSASAYTYGDMSDASPFMLLKRALETTSLYNSNLLSNINALYDDCASSAYTSGDVDIEDLRTNTFDIFATLDGLKHNTLQTTIYSDTNPSGIGATCTEAYNNVETSLNDPAIFDDTMSVICTEIGLDISTTSERTICQDKITRSFDLIYANNAGVVDWRTALENLLFAESINNALLSGSTSDAINQTLSRQMLAESLGQLETQARTVPVLKGIMFSIIIGIIPILLMMVATSIIGKVLKLYFGLIIFYAFWMMADIVSLRAIEDSLYATTSLVRTSNMGLLAIWNSPQVLVDTLSLISQTRLSAMGISVLMVASLFGISAYAMQSVGSQVEGGIEEKGKQLGQQNILSEQAGRELSDLSEGNAAFASISSVGATETTYADAFSRDVQAKAGLLEAEGLGGFSTGSTALSQTQASQSVGESLAVQSEGYGSATASATIEKEGQFADSSALTSVADATNQTTKEAQFGEAAIQHGQDAGKAQELSDRTGGLASALLAGQAEGARISATSDEVESQGTDGIYSVQSQELQSQSEKAFSTENLTLGNTRDFFGETSDREVLDAQGLNLGDRAFGDNQVRQAGAGQRIDSIQESLSKTGQLGNLSERKEFAHDISTRETAEAQAEERFKEQIQEASGLSNVDTAALLASSRNLNLSPEVSESLEQSGVLPASQADFVRDQGGASVSADILSTEEGLQTLSSGATANASLTSDASFKEDSSIERNSGVSHDTAFQPFNTASAGILFSDSEKFASYVDDLESKTSDENLISRQVGIGAATALEGLGTMTQSDLYLGSNSIENTNSASKGLPGVASIVSGLDASIAVSNTNQAVDQNVESRDQNLFPSHFTNVYESIRGHNDDLAERGVITEDEASERTADIFTGYHGFFTEGFQRGDHEEFNKLLVNGDIDQVWDDYNGNNNIELQKRETENESGEFFRSETQSIIDEYGNVTVPNNHPSSQYSDIGAELPHYSEYLQPNEGDDFLGSHNSGVNDYQPPYTPQSTSAQQVPSPVQQSVVSNNDESMPLTGGQGSNDSEPVSPMRVSQVQNLPHMKSL